MLRLLIKDMTVEESSIPKQLFDHSEVLLKPPIKTLGYSIIQRAANESI